MQLVQMLGLLLHCSSVQTGRDTYWTGLQHVESESQCFPQSLKENQKTVLHIQISPCMRDIFPIARAYLGVEGGVGAPVLRVRHVEAVGALQESVSPLSRVLPRAAAPSTLSLPHQLLHQFLHAPHACYAARLRAAEICNEQTN